MEYCSNGSLSDLMMRGKFSLKEDEIRYVISEVLMGVAYLHKDKKIHRVIYLYSILTIGYQIWQYLALSERSCQAG